MSVQTTNTFQKTYNQLLPIFKPRSIAVIGASHSAGKWGYKMIEWPLMAGYTGKIYPVNAKEKEVLGLKAYPNVLDVPDEIDMAVMVVPAVAVPQAFRDCVSKGIKAIVMISSGFAEVGEKGKALQDEIVQIARSGNLRFVGPNGQGVWCASVKLNLSFERVLSPGRIAFISQSGAFGTELVDQADSLGYHVGLFASVGNQADLVFADYLEYLAEEPDISAIILYLEGVKDGRRFLEVARKVTAQKPILVLKGGRTSAGSTAASSHTASLAGEYRIFEAACKQVGVMIVTEAMEPFCIADALIHQPLARGPRIALMGTGGQCVTLADACTSLGLQVPYFDEATIRELQKILPGNAPVPRNTVDWAGGYRTPMDEARLVDRLLSLDYVDGIIINAPFLMPFPGVSTPEAALQSSIDAIKMFKEVSWGRGKPIITLGPIAAVLRDKMKEAGIPCYDTPGDCARAMNGLVRYAEIRQCNSSAL